MSEHEHGGAIQVVAVKAAERAGNTEKVPNMLTSHRPGYTFRELTCDDARGMGWVSRDGTDVAATGAMELSRSDNLAIAAAICNGLNREKETMWFLDKAWNDINALGGRCGEYDDYGKGINYAVGQALSIIEDLGGMDPLQRARDNGPFGVGA